MKGGEISTDGENAEDTLLGESILRRSGNWLLMVVCLA